MAEWLEEGFGSMTEAVQHLATNARYWIQTTVYPPPHAPQKKNSWKSTKEDIISFMEKIIKHSAKMEGHWFGMLEGCTAAIPGERPGLMVASQWTLQKQTIFQIHFKISYPLRIKKSVLITLQKSSFALARLSTKPRLVFFLSTILDISLLKKILL
jgi:hypothetical protein